LKRASLVVKVIMKQLFVALKRLHGMGIVHRDIKPVRGRVRARARVRAAIHSRNSFP